MPKWAYYFGRSDRKLDDFKGFLCMIYYEDIINYDQIDRTLNNMVTEYGYDAWCHFVQAIVISNYNYYDNRIDRLIHDFKRHVKMKAFL
jgi:hypothetical protein